jgi:hypothetical protein
MLRPPRTQFAHLAQDIAAALVIKLDRADVSRSVGSTSPLPGLVSRADVLYFPIDGVSHDAVATIKPLCRQLEKPCSR